jgi:hypothetical protein
MPLKFVCSRCTNEGKAELPSVNQGYSPKLPAGWSQILVYQPDGNPQPSRDLCEECLKEFDKWLNTAPSRKAKATQR